MQWNRPIDFRILRCEIADEIDCQVYISIQLSGGEGRGFTGFLLRDPVILLHRRFLDQPVFACLSSPFQIQCLLTKVTLSVTGVYNALMKTRRMWQWLSAIRRPETGPPCVTVPLQLRRDKALFASHTRSQPTTRGSVSKLARKQVDRHWQVNGRRTHEWNVQVPSVHPSLNCSWRQVNCTLQLLHVDKKTWPF